jgi:multiple antibiotic resistance protein
MFEHLLKTFTTLFFVIDPIGLIPIFLMLTCEEGSAQKRKIALKATIIAAIILLSFAFVGDFILDSLKISENAFQVAGGLLLLLVAIDMVLARHSGISSTTKSEQEEAIQRDDVSVFPLAIPLIAGPGALTAMAILMRRVEGDIVQQAGVMAAILIALLITFVFLVLSEQIAKLLGVTGTNVITRVFGIILAALAIQFIMDGLTEAFFN